MRQDYVRSAYCEVCDGIIPSNSRRKSYCSVECKKIGRLNKSREYQREISMIDIELGRCIVCHQDNNNLKFRVCAKCRLKQRKQFERRKQNGRN